ncbi:MAG: radical SAM protein [Candidatus Omnitrophota bacterium]|nr:MAG: radical SAM protein [Candidatus Omnitrophota bacterium]
MKNYKYIYGPVPSWRLGSSLGIDPLSEKVKICNFDCIYCQIGKTKIFAKERKVFVPTAKIIKEIKSLPAVRIDYITFSGSGEPTLAKNLGQMIKAIKKISKEKIAVLTNSSLMHRKDVQKDLLLADFVVAKLDAHLQDIFVRINQPMKTIGLEKIIKGIKKFKGKFRGKLALQIMFIDENKKYAKQISKIVRKIDPDEVQLNTPLRPCGVRPLSRKELAAIKQYFKGMNCIFVYGSEKKKVKPISKKETIKRRGKIQD